MAGNPETGPETKRGTALLEATVGAVIMIVCTALAIAMPNLVAEGGVIEAQDFIRVSPIFFPRLAFALTGLTALLFFIRTVQSFPPPSDVKEASQTRAHLNVLFVFGVVLVYAYLLVWFGYGFATLVAVGVMTYFLGNRVWWQISLFALLSPIVTRFIFERVFSISLPRPEIDSMAALEEALMQMLSHLFHLR